MVQPIKPSNIDEETAEPDAVDYPVQSVVRELDADTTTVEGVEDTGYVFDQQFPGDNQDMPKAKGVVLRANRVTEVSDLIVFGAADIAADTPSFILVPAHRDRLRVTVQADFDAADVSVYLGHGPDISPGQGWRLLSNQAVTFETRDAIYATSGAGANPTRIQWAIELVSEGANVGPTNT